MILQKTFNQVYTNNSGNPIALNPDGTTVEFTYPQGYYTVIVIFKCALDPLSTKRLESFCGALQQFYEEDVRIFGVNRDNLTVLKHWMSKVGNVNFPLVSDMNIGEENIGIPQFLEVPLIDGYPAPTTLVLDQTGRVRYTESTDPEVSSVDEILRFIRALKTVDEGKGERIIPADWMEGEAAIRNTKEGVAEFYEEKYKDDGKTKSKDVPSTNKSQEHVEANVTVSKPVGEEKNKTEKENSDKVKSEK